MAASSWLFVRARLLVRALVLVVLLAGVWSITPQAAMSLSGPGVPKNVILFYDDYPTRGDPQFQVTLQIAKPLVTHIDKKGRPNDWMFDSFIFYSMWLYVTRKPTQAYIDSWISYLFDGQQVANLDRAVDSAKKALRNPDYQMNIFLALPVAYEAVDSSSILNNADKVLSRWASLNPTNLRLTGFYWGFTEDLWFDGSATILPTISQYVHSKGLKLLMIPYLSAYGYDRLHVLGFDYVTMQPNYAWDAKSNATSFAIVNKSIADGYSDGVEFELPYKGGYGPMCCGGDWRVNLKTYFDQAQSYNWKSTVLQTYYEGSGISLMGRSSDVNSRNAYEMIYQYIASTR